MFSNKNSFWLRNAEFLTDISQPIFFWAMGQKVVAMKVSKVLKPLETYRNSI
jgi:hypothetical protein